MGIYIYIHRERQRQRETTYVLNNHNSGYCDLTLYNETSNNDGLITSGQKLPLKKNKKQKKTALGLALKIGFTKGEFDLAF